MQISPDQFKKDIADKGMSQTEFAQYMGLTRNTIAQWIYKESIPKKYVKRVKEILSNENIGSEIIQSSMTPYYDVDVTAGAVEFWDNPSETPSDYVHTPGLNADFCVPVYGHSMYPEICNGDKVAVRKINDMSFFNYGHKYLIVTAEHRMIKYVKKSDIKGNILLTSRNETFDDIELPADKIKGLFLIVEVIHREVI